MDGYWELDFHPAGTREAASANAEFVQTLNRLRESHPERFRKLVLFLRAAISPKFMKRLEQNEPLKRPDCRVCHGPIDYTSYDWDWNIEAANEGFCGIQCKDAFVSSIPTDLIVGVTDMVADWLTDQRNYDAFDTAWDEERQQLVVKFLKGATRVTQDDL